MLDEEDFFRNAVSTDSSDKNIWSNNEGTEISGEPRW